MNTKMTRIPLPDRFTNDDGVAAAVLGKLHHDGIVQIWNFDGMDAKDVLELISGTTNLYYHYDSDFALVTSWDPNSLATKINGLVSKAEYDEKFLGELEEIAENELGLDVYNVVMNS